MRSASDRRSSKVTKFKKVVAVRQDVALGAPEGDVQPVALRDDDSVDDAPVADGEAVMVGAAEIFDVSDEDLRLEQVLRRRR